MPQSLPEIPLGTPIVESEGTINIFFRQLWQLIQTAFRLVPTVANITLGALTAAIATTPAYTTLTPARYRVSVYLQKTVADGVSSSLTVTLSWTSNGTPVSKTFAAFTTDAAGANDSNVWTVHADGSSDISYAVAYASNTPNRMTYIGYVVVEQMA